jgi:bifunctional ADP-heptose synthase (sugar kinase/adenylyltransferase)
MENILVLGDCMLDKYIYCQSRKINSECPNIVLKEDEIVYKSSKDSQKKSRCSMA